MCRQTVKLLGLFLSNPQEFFSTADLKPYCAEVWQCKAQHTTAVDSTNVANLPAVNSEPAGCCQCALTGWQRWGSRGKTAVQTSACAAVLERCFLSRRRCRSNSTSRIRTRRGTVLARVETARQGCCACYEAMGIDRLSINLLRHILCPAWPEGRNNGIFQ